MLSLKLFKPLGGTKTCKGTINTWKLFIHHDNADLFSSKGCTVVWCYLLAKVNWEKRSISINHLNLSCEDKIGSINCLALVLYWVQLLFSSIVLLFCIFEHNISSCCLSATAGGKESSSPLAEVLSQPCKKVYAHIAREKIQKGRAD